MIFSNDYYYNVEVIKSANSRLALVSYNSVTGKKHKKIDISDISISDFVENAIVVTLITGDRLVLSMKSQLTCEAMISIIHSGITDATQLLQHFNKGDKYGGSGIKMPCNLIMILDN